MSRQNLKCEVNGCNTVGRRTRGRCDKHYAEWRRSGAAGAICSVDSCNKGVNGKGLCGTHQYRLKNGLDLDEPVRAAGPWGDWFSNAKGYILRRRTEPGTGKRTVQWQHQLVVEESIGRPLAPNEEVHHKNGNRADNRIENLQLWSTSQPKGQHWRDKLEYAREILALYGPLEASGFHDGGSGDS